MAQTPEAPPPRRWFQFHLSTAILLMILAGWLLWMNLRVSDHGSWGICMTGIEAYDRLFILGWPTGYLECQRTEAVLVSLPHETRDYDSVPTVAPDPPSVADMLSERPFCDKKYSFHWRSLGLVVNLVVALVLLTATAMLLEWLQRRFARRKASR